MRRMGRDRALWGGIGGMIAGVLLIAFSPSVIGTIFGALVMGSFGTLSLLANQAILSDLHGDQRTIALDGIECRRYLGRGHRAAPHWWLCRDGLGVADGPGVDGAHAPPCCGGFFAACASLRARPSNMDT